MIRKAALGGALVCALLTSAALPAAAAPAPRWKSHFVGGTDANAHGNADVHYRADKTYSADIELKQLDAGEYYVFLNAYVDANKDGFPDSGGSQLVCKIKSDGKKRDSCKGTGMKFDSSFKPWSVTVQPVAPNPNIVAARADFAH